MSAAIAPPVATEPEETMLLIADTDRALAFLELSDLALGRFARSYLIQVEKSIGLHAGNQKLPLDLAMSMHGSIALYRIAEQANAGELIFKHKGVEWGGSPRGDWSITITRNQSPLVDTAS